MKRFTESTHVNTVSNDKYVVLTTTGGNDYIASKSLFFNTIKKLWLIDGLLAKIGDIYINTDNQHKNKPSFIKGFFEYLYLDGRTLNRVDYPDLALALGYSTDTFTIPNSQGDRYLKNLNISTERDLMSVEAWKTGKPISFTLDTTGNHRHGMGHQHNVQMIGHSCTEFSSESAQYGSNRGTMYTTGGRNETDDSGNHSHNSSGWDTQTEVNNIGIQLYIKSKLVGL